MQVKGSEELLSQLKSWDTKNSRIETMFWENVASGKIPVGTMSPRFLYEILLEGDSPKEAIYEEEAAPVQIAGAVDVAKRTAHDHYGHAGVDQAAAVAGAGGKQAGSGDRFTDMMLEVYGYFGGKRQGHSNVFRGADLRYDLEIAPEQAAHGIETEIRIPRLSACKTCHGSGTKPGTQPTTCIDCPGAGRIKHLYTLSVRIPAGVEEADRVRLTGEGEAGVNGGPSGDLYVHVHLKAHQVFQRDHDDLNLVEKIKQLKELLDTKLIEQDEFDRKKKDLLSRL